MEGHSPEESFEPFEPPNGGSRPPASGQRARGWRERIQAAGERSARVAGLLRLMLGLGFFPVAYLLMLEGVWAAEERVLPGGVLSMIGVGLLMAAEVPVMQGLLEVVTGLRFARMEKAWAALSGWQRLGLSVLILPPGIVLAARLIAQAVIRLQILTGW